MKNCLRTLVLFCLLFSCIFVVAQTFQTERLAKAVEVLGVNLPTDTLYFEHTLEVKTKDNQTLCIRINQNGEIEHIGIPLFSVEMRSLISSPIYDFMEYAVLNWKYKVSSNLLYLSKVIFQKGDWNTLLTERLYDCECNIRNQDDQLYILNWSRDGQEVVTVGIPIEYELLNNDSRRNIEKDFIRQLATHKVSNMQSQNKIVTENDLKIYGTEGLFVLPGQSYILAELNQNVYYTLSTIYETVDTIIRGQKDTMTVEEVLPAIVMDEEHPTESFANLMMANVEFVPDVQIALDFHLSDYHHHHLTIPLKQLQDFLIQQECSTYFACKGIVNNELCGVFFVRNSSKGYNHLMSVRLPVAQLTSPHPEVQANAYLYIPPVDQTHLFGKTPTKKSGAKIY